MSINDDYRDDLSALIDGALDDDRRREVEEALHGDPALWAEYKRLLKVDALYAELPREAAPEGFAQAVRDALARRDSMAGPEPPKTAVKFRPFTKAARRSVFWPLAAAATLLVGFFLYTTTQTARQSRTMLSMEKAAAPAKAAELKAKDDQRHSVGMMPADEAKAEAPAPAPLPAAAPAAPAPAPEPAVAAEEAAGDGVEAETQNVVQPAPPGSMPLLEALRKEDRERALGRRMAAQQQPAPQAPPPPPPVPGEPINEAVPVEEAPQPPVTATTEVRPPVPAAESAAEAGTAAPAAPPAEQRRVAGRVFLRTNYGWVDQAYKGEVLTPLELDSDEFRELLPTHPPLEQVAALGGTITLRVDGVWRDLKTGKPVAEPQ